MVGILVVLILGLSVSFTWGEMVGPMFPVCFWVVAGGGEGLRSFGTVRSSPPVTQAVTIWWMRCRGVMTLLATSVGCAASVYDSSDDGVDAVGAVQAVKHVLTDQKQVTTTAEVIQSDSNDRNDLSRIKTSPAGAPRQLWHSIMNVRSTGCASETTSGILGCGEGATSAVAGEHFFFSACTCVSSGFA